MALPPNIDMNIVNSNANNSNARNDIVNSNVNNNQMQVPVIPPIPSLPTIPALQNLESSTDDIKSNGNNIYVSPIPPTARGPYQSHTPAVKLQIAKEAAKHGISITIAKYPDLKLSWSTVKGWVKKYKAAKQAQQEGSVMYRYNCLI